LNVKIFVKEQVGAAVEIDTAAQILKESMIDAEMMFLKDVPVLVNVLVVDNWYEK
jgi:hypothetical protein